MVFILSACKKRTASFHLERSSSESCLFFVFCFSGQCAILYDIVQQNINKQLSLACSTLYCDLVHVEQYRMTVFLLYAHALCASHIQADRHLCARFTCFIHRQKLLPLARAALTFHVVAEDR